MILLQLDSEQLNSLIQNAVRKAISETPKVEQPTETPDQLLTVHEAAEFLNLAVATVYTMVSRGELPVMKRSKRLYFSRIELMDYLKQGRRKTLAETASEADQYLKSN